MIRSPTPQPDALKRAADRADAWMSEQALPLWAGDGRAAGGDFIESLALDGTPQAAQPRRTLVQSRQIFAFCEAARVGWYSNGDDIARVAVDRLLGCNRHPEGGWVHAVDASGRPTDRRRQLYDHAFVLFALAQAHTMLGDARARAEAEATLAFLDAALADTTRGGFREGLPGTLPRRSNPHMHVLEALLFWLEATHDPVIAARAQRLVDLFETAFFDAAAGVLTEFFDDAWRPADGALGNAVEPGHLYEWSWLLTWAAQLGLRTPAGAAERLFAFAERHGRDADGFVIDGCDRWGQATATTRRLWPQTERIKALVARGRSGDSAAAGQAADHAVRLLDTYLAGPVPGGWIDRFDAQGRPDVDRIPASSLYHLALAFSELRSMAEAGSAARLASPHGPV